MSRLLALLALVLVACAAQIVSPVELLANEPPQYHTSPELSFFYKKNFANTGWSLNVTKIKAYAHLIAYIGESEPTCQLPHENSETGCFFDAEGGGIRTCETNLGPCEYTQDELVFIHISTTDLEPEYELSIVEEELSFPELESGAVYSYSIGVDEPYKPFVDLLFPVNTQGLTSIVATRDSEWDLRIDALSPTVPYKDSCNNFQSSITADPNRITSLFLHPSCRNLSKSQDYLRLSSGSGAQVNFDLVVTHSTLDVTPIDPIGTEVTLTATIGIPSVFSFSIPSEGWQEGRTWLFTVNHSGSSQYNVATVYKSHEPGLFIVPTCEADFAYTVTTATASSSLVTSVCSSGPNTDVLLTVLLSGPDAYYGLEDNFTLSFTEQSSEISSTDAALNTPYTLQPRTELQDYDFFGIYSVPMFEGGVLKIHFDLEYNSSYDFKISVSASPSFCNPQEQTFVAAEGLNSYDYYLSNCDFMSHLSWTGTGYVQIYAYYEGEDGFEDGEVAVSFDAVVSSQLTVGLNSYTQGFPNLLVVPQPPEGSYYQASFDTSANVAIFHLQMVDSESGAVCQRNPAFNSCGDANIYCADYVCRRSYPVELRVVGNQSEPFSVNLTEHALPTLLPGQPMTGTVEASLSHFIIGVPKGTRFRLEGTLDGDVDEFFFRANCDVVYDAESGPDRASIESVDEWLLTLGTSSTIDYNLSVVAGEDACFEVTADTPLEVCADVIPIGRYDVEDLNAALTNVNYLIEDLTALTEGAACDNQSIISLACRTHFPACLPTGYGQLPCRGDCEDIFDACTSGGCKAQVCAAYDTPCDVIPSPAPPVPSPAEYPSPADSPASDSTPSDSDPSSPNSDPSSPNSDPSSPNSDPSSPNSDPSSPNSNPNNSPNSDSSSPNAVAGPNVPSPPSVIGGVSPSAPLGPTPTELTGAAALEVSLIAIGLALLACRVAI